MQKKQVYLDFNATTPLHPEVIARLSDWAKYFGNPSSIHDTGRGPKQILRETRQKWAHILNVSPLELVFTSGASESNSSIFKSAWSLKSQTRNKIIISSVEHPSVAKSAKYLESQGAKVVLIQVRRNGQIDLDQYKQELDESTLLVSIMLANNETGTIFPVKEMAQMAKALGALFHTDAVQALGKMPISLLDLGVDYASFSAHKFYSLKGCGLLYIKKGSPYQPLIHGGGQERSRRGGTENVLSIAAFGEVANLISNLNENINSMRLLRDYFEMKVTKLLSDVKITSFESERIPNTSSLVIDGVDGETLLMSMDLNGFCVSTGAACSSGNPEPSPVLLAVGLSRAEAQSSLRVSLGHSTTKEEIDLFLETLTMTVERLRRLKKTSEAEVQI